MGAWRRFTTCAAGFLLLTGTSHAAETSALSPGCPGSISWDAGAGTTAWATLTNWSPNRLPTSADDVCIPELVAGVEVLHSTGTNAVNSIAGPGGLQVSGGTLSFSLGSPGLGQLVLTGGTLSGTGDLPVDSGFTWSAGAMTGSGTTRVTDPTLSGSSNKNLSGGRILQTLGTTTWTGAGPLRVDTAAEIENGGTWDAQGNATLANLGSAGGFQNASGSVFQKSAGGGTTSVEVPFDNAGTVSVQSGTVSFSGGSSTTGSFQGSAGTTVQFAGGVHTLAVGSSLAVPTVVVSGSSLDVSGIYVASTSTFSGGAAVSFPSAATVLGIGGLTIAGASVDFSSGEAIEGTFLSFLNGTLSGADDVTFETMGWSAGTMTGPGTTTVHRSDLTGSGVKALSAGRVLRNDLHGPVFWEGSGPIQLGQGCLIQNFDTWYFQGFTNMIMANLGGAAGFENLEGAFLRKSNTGTNVVEVPFTNRGHVIVGFSGINLGMLRFEGGYTQISGTTRVVGGTLSSTTPLAIQGGRLEGQATVAADVMSSGTVAPGIAGPAEPLAVLTITGTYAQRADGTLEIEIGGSTPGDQHDQLAVSGAVSLAGALNVSLIGGFVPQDTDTFTILTSSAITGSFASTSLPPLGGGMGWAVFVNPTAVVLEVGPDGDGDGIQNAGDCAPADASAWASPGEVAGVSFLADKETLSWTSQTASAGTGTVYDAVRGHLSDLPVGGAGETCVLSGGGTPQVVDSTMPDLETAFYYLVRGRNACGTGTYGTQTGGALRTTAACP